MATAAPPSAYEPAAPPWEANPAVRDEQRDRSEREVHLTGERDRGERQRCEHEAPPLEREQHRRQEEGDLAEQMPRALLDAIGREREDHAA